MTIRHTLLSRQSSWVRLSKQQKAGKDASTCWMRKSRISLRKLLRSPETGARSLTSWRVIHECSKTSFMREEQPISLMMHTEISSSKWTRGTRSTCELILLALLQEMLLLIGQKACPKAKSSCRNTHRMRKGMIRDWEWRVTWQNKRKETHLKPFTDHIIHQLNLSLDQRQLKGEILIMAGIKAWTSSEILPSLRWTDQRRTVWKWETCLTKLSKKLSLTSDVTTATMILKLSLPEEPSSRFDEWNSQRIGQRN